jgi:thioesterase domain-containing protein/acyl carrier protein
MAVVWQDLLKRERIGVTDNFFRLGGNSLVAVSLVARAEREVGVEFPLSTILDHPTIEGLLGSLGSGPVVRAKPRHLVTLNRGGSLPPLVLMSGLGGHAFVFQGLARVLGSNQPIHVLTAIGAEDESEGLNHTIEEMAEIYEPEILAACGTGPIILGGYSFGMLVAYQIARRMQALGRAFPLLVSFDGFAPGFPKLQPLPQRLLAHARFFAAGKGAGRRAYLRDRMRAIKARINDRLGRSEENYEAIPYANPDTDVRLRKMSAALWKSGLRYLPPSVASSDLLLVKTSIGEHWIGNDMDDPLYGWSSWVDGKITVVTVPGEHLRLFDEANQRKIADAIADAIATHGSHRLAAESEDGALPQGQPGRSERTGDPLGR